MVLARIGLVGSLLLSASSVGAQSADPVTSDGRPVPVAPAVVARGPRGVTLRATRIATPLRIDRRLDEAVYEQVQPIVEFEQQEPHEGQPVSEPTQAWLLYDGRFVHVGCRCGDAH